MGEKDLRSQVALLVRPEYPSESLTKGVTGLAVALVEVDEFGVVDGIHVLQAPDTACARAVESAIRQWKFEIQYLTLEQLRTHPAARLGLARVAAASLGKVSFNFRIINGKGVVEDGLMRPPIDEKE